MAEAVEVVVTLEGGIVQSVCVGGVPVRVRIVDYDADGGSVVEVPQTDADPVEATVYDLAPHIDGAWVAAVHALDLPPIE